MALFKFFFESVFVSGHVEPASPEEMSRVRKRVDDFFYTFVYLEKTILFGVVLCLDAILEPLVSTFRVFALKLDSDDFWRDLFSIALVWQGFAVLTYVNVSKAYHLVRGQSTLKLYVLIGILQMFNTLLGSVGAYFQKDLFAAPTRRPSRDVARSLFIAALYVDVHATVQLTMLVTLNAAINSKTDAVLGVFFLNNMAEIKSFVFKNYARPARLGRVVLLDVVERFGVFFHLALILAHSLSHFSLGAEWVRRFALLSLVYLALEVGVDYLKHAFISLTNGVDPVFYERVFTLLCSDYLSQKKGVRVFPSAVPAHERMQFPAIAMAALGWRMTFRAIVTVGGFAFLVQSIVCLLLLKGILAMWLTSASSERLKKHLT
ncbi:Transmembrane anterior posterior transformation protein 1 [Bonamia ostreae]|uniref:Transmembrane anterior posterior transformation protein 1 n=1 Tax=Bonamia ostreae TaxID=126728 RepID=A0ABV2AF36_9EUKA